MFRFLDSYEATLFLEKLEEMINDPRIDDWAGETSSAAVTKLIQLQKDVKDFCDEFYENNN
jgi:hypothetical protein